jgi:hypothetical protein
VTFVQDGENVTISFPDGTEFAQKDRIFSHPNLPDFQVCSDRLVVETRVFKAAFTDKLSCSFELKNGDCGVTFEDAHRQVMITFGPLKNFMTMVDLISGVVANMGARRYVYYLNDEWQWTIGRQLCSKKDLVQHFEAGDFVERLEPVPEMDREEIEAIVGTGQKPRLFIIEKDVNALTVRELIHGAEFQTIMEQSKNRISKKDDSNVTLWFDTEPPSYRQIRIGTKITPEQKAAVFAGMVRQREIERNRTSILNSVGDPKWRKLEDEQEQEEADILALLERYNAKLPVAATQPA